MRNFFALSLIAALCACSSGDPQVALPQSGVSGPGGGDLTQTADLDGRYIDTIRIAPEGWKNITPGQQVTITFEATGLAQVKQFEIVIEPQPGHAFELDSAVFKPQAPFITPFASGLQQDADGSLHLGGASLGSVVTGNQVLGTLTLTMASGVGGLTAASLRVTLISIGPTSQDRERYEGDALRFGVQVN